MERYTFFATCPLYLEELLKTELESFGGSDIQIAHGGCGFNGTIETAYRACLWSRIANRILFPLVSFDADKPEDISRAADSFEWENHFPLSSTIAIDSTLTKTKICTPDYASLSVKDGIVDRARRLTGGRPNVDTANPDIRLHLHITLNRGGIALDLSGDGLHKRGYRIETVKAGVRENTAAAMLLRADWQGISAPLRTTAANPADSAPELNQPALFFDPMCGSGTLVTEAALIAADIAPSINRRRFGFEKWKHHNPALWSRLKAEADSRRADGIAAVKQAALKAGTALFTGRDQNPKAVAASRANLRASAVSDLFTAGIIRIESGDFFKSASPAALTVSVPQHEASERQNVTGLLAVNPPYGERLNKNDDMLMFYRRMGEVFKQEYGGWNIVMLTGHRELSEATGLRAEKINTLYNGGLRCTLSHFRIFTERYNNTGKQTGGTAANSPGTAPRTQQPAAEKPSGRREFPTYDELSPGAQMVCNRLKKNAKRLKSWLKQSGSAGASPGAAVECYRLYDADMPEYSAAVDIYPPEAVIQEYAAPKTIDPVAASGRLRELMLAVQAYLQLPEEAVKLKQRRKQSGSSQYERKTDNSERRIIREHGLKFFIDTSTYLDTGIFLDSRPIRALIKKEAKGKNFLNLFCYTGTASVYAAAGGAVTTTSVDTSKTYLDWAEANMRLNGFRNDAEFSHSYVRNDCMEWLRKAMGRWELIYLDPPTFSNSKDRREIFDLQKDHEELIRLALSRLADDGLLIFCNNFRKFKMSAELESDFLIEEISEQTIDPDFERKKSIHRCWKIRKE